MTFFFHFSMLKKHFQIRSHEMSHSQRQKNDQTQNVGKECSVCFFERELLASVLEGHSWTEDNVAVVCSFCGSLYVDRKTETHAETLHNLHLIGFTTAPQQFGHDTKKLYKKNYFHFQRKKWKHLNHNLIWHRRKRKCSARSNLIESDWNTFL